MAGQREHRGDRKGRSAPLPGWAAIPPQLRHLSSRRSRRQDQSPARSARLCGGMRSPGWGKATENAQEATTASMRVSPRTGSDTLPPPLPPHPARFLCNHRSGLHRPAEDVRKRGRQSCQEKPAEVAQVEAQETPPHLGPARRRRPRARPPRSRAPSAARPAAARSGTGQRDARGGAHRTSGCCPPAAAHCPSARLARTKGSRGAVTAKPDPRARRAARAASEVRSAVTAAGRRAGPRERVTRAAVSRAPRRPPGDAHAGTRRLLLAPRPAARRPPRGPAAPSAARSSSGRAGGAARGCPWRSQSVPAPPPQHPEGRKEEDRGRRRQGRGTRGVDLLFST